ncbi:MAG: hypothetical protein H0U13_05090 [Gemmatimonadaceae bacterium]|nr:hypothetical protein [Gemmatimonadaceae bacterium]
MSPRLGFVWNYKGLRGFQSRGTELYTINQGAPQFRGGIGLFRGMYSSSAVSRAALSAQNIGTASDLECFGSDIPAPAWNAFQRDRSTIPRTCNDASGGLDARRQVSFLDRAFEPPQNWRAALGWSGSTPAGHFTIDGTVSINTHQSGIDDRNFLGQDKLMLNDGRPIYVSAQHIDQTTGAVMNAGSRIDPSLNKVLVAVDDLRGFARSLTAYFIPAFPEKIGLLSFSYSLASARGQHRGFGTTTGGDPRIVTSYRDGFTRRHTLIVQAAHLFRQVGITATLRAASGLPFTPLVGSDINGDGFANDRAFVSDVGAVYGTTENAFQQLLSEKSVRDCLRPQLNRIAAPNSCIGPGSLASYLTVVMRPSVPGTSGRTHLTATFSNILGGVDRLFNGQSARGWGVYSFPDPVLYRATGFDPVGKSFSYEVNSGFGRVRRGVNANPFQASVNLKIDLGRPPREQLLEQDLRVRPALVGTRATAAQLKQRIVHRGYTDIYGFMIAKADSLALSRQQVEVITERRGGVLTYADSLYTALASHLTELPQGANTKDALARIDSVNTLAWNGIFAQREFLLELLTPGQLLLLPGDFYRLLTIPEFKRRFFFGGFSTL